MERYDKKTSQDDYRKYSLITVCVLIAVVLWCLFLHFFSNDDPDPDYRVIYAGYSFLSDDMEKYLENYIGEIVGDSNNDGEIVVEILCVEINTEDYANSSASFLQLGELMGEDDIYLALLTDEPVHIANIDFDGISCNFCGQEGYFIELPGKIADTEFSNRASLNDSELFTYLGFADGPLLYGSVIEGPDNEATQLALDILEQMIYGDID